jgi:O-antigen/teichoic acid export membrane protein
MRLDQRKMGVLLTYVSEAIKILTTLVYTPLMLRLLGDNEYGLYQTVSSTVAYLSLLSLGFGSAYVRYHSRYQVKHDESGIARLNGMFMLVFCAMSVICLVAGGVMIGNARAIFGDKLTAAELEQAKLLMAVLILSMAVTFPNSVFNCYVTAHEKFIFQKLLIVVQNVLNPCLTLPLLMLGYGSVAVVAVSAVSSPVSESSSALAASADALSSPSPSESSSASELPSEEFLAASSAACLRLSASSWAMRSASSLACSSTTS